MAAFIPRHPPPPPPARPRPPRHTTDDDAAVSAPAKRTPTCEWLGSDEPASQPADEEGIDAPIQFARGDRGGAACAHTFLPSCSLFIPREERDRFSWAGGDWDGAGVCVCVCEKGVGLSSPTPLLAVERAAAAAAGAGRALRTCPFLLCLSLLWTRRR